MVDSLPTCWYCPECGAIPYESLEPDQRWNVCDCVDADFTYEERKIIRDGWQRIPAIPPGTPPEQILNLVGEVRAAMPATETEGVLYVVVIPRTEATDGR